jgi:diketogulonate reductase-like aldo/keto reductase
LGLDYVDMYLIHNPVGTVYVSDDAILPTNPDGTVQLDMNTDLEGIWKGMEGLVKAGKAKSIGVSNFTRGQVERIVKAGTLKPANLQVELSLNMQQKPLREVCKRHGIAVTSYSSLGKPSFFLSTFSQNRLLYLN